MKNTRSPKFQFFKHFRASGILKLIVFCWIVIFLSGQIIIAQSKARSSSTVKQEYGKGAFATGKYRDLFIENGHAQKEISSKNEAAFNQLFHGDSATQTVCFKAGMNEYGPLEYVSDVLHHDV